MINFRYHIVSLMAVFLALAVGIVMGVTLLGDRVNQGIVLQAAQDRKDKEEYRRQLEQLKALNDYRDAYEQRVGAQITKGALNGVQVALVAMPGAPSNTIDDLRKAIAAAGGAVASETKIDQSAFDPARSADVLTTLSPYGSLFDGTDAVSAKLGMVLSRGLAAGNPTPLDPSAKSIRQTLQKAGLVSIKSNQDTLADAVIVVTAIATDPPVANDLLLSHVRMQESLKTRARSVVIAGPTSTGVDGTDLGVLKQVASAWESLSSVNVADLASGVTTVILATREQLQGGQGHYGAGSDVDGIAPSISK